MYFTADHHFCHENIIKYQNRPFSNAEEMDSFMIEKWNEIVSPNDTVYHLGDFCLGTPSKCSDILSQLNGTIISVYGNHDRRQVRRLLGSQDKIILSQHHLILTHYVENEIPHNWVNLHGHTHGRVEDKKNLLDVGVDNHGYRPLHIDEIRSLLRNLPSES